MKSIGLFVVGLVIMGTCATAEAAFTPRAWVQGGVSVVAGVVKGADEVAEAVWDAVHGDILHPLGNWGRSIVDGIVSIGTPSAQPTE